MNQTSSRLSQHFLDFLVELLRRQRTILVERLAGWDDILPDKEYKLSVTVLHALQLHTDELLQRLIIELKLFDLLH